MATPKYFEKHGAAFYAQKRLNPKHGTYPLFEARYKRKLAATTEAEAIKEALEVVDRLEQLQTVCLKDSKGHRVSVRDMNVAVQTWLDVVASFDFDRARKLSKKNTLEAQEAKEALAHYTLEVVGHFEKRGLAPDGGESHTLSTFGDHLYQFLKDGVLETTLKDAVVIYLRQTNRDHLPESNKAVRDTNRPVEHFIEIVGDKNLEDISRKDISFYVDTRRKSIKTTSVEREISTLRAVWHKAALVGDLRQQNPFAETSIRGLGLDSNTRHTPSLEEVTFILNTMEEKYAKAPSYVSCMTAVAALTGARLSEVWGLEQNDHQGDNLYIRPNNTRSTLKTKNSIRPFPVLPLLALWLKRHFSEAKPSSANSASAACNKALKGLSPLFIMHGFRHGFKQMLVDADAPINVIDELQGWSSQRMSDLYGKNTARESKTLFVRKVYAKLAPLDTKKSNVVKLKSVKG